MTGLKLPQDIEDLAQRLYDGGSYEAISEHLIRGFYESYLRPGDTVIDVGVHYGLHLFPMTEAVGTHGKVIGIEASPERYEAIGKKVKNHGLTQVALHNLAASTKAGTATFYLNLDFTGRSGLLKNDKTGRDDFRQVEVTTCRLDEALSDLDALRFIKVDIEGAEAAALVGADRLLRRFWPVLIYEGEIGKSIEAFGLSKNETRTITEDYLHYDLGARALQAATKSRGWNFLAVPRAASQQLRNEVAAGMAAAWSNLPAEFLS